MATTENVLTGWHLKRGGPLGSWKRRYYTLVDGNSPGMEYRESPEKPPINFVPFSAVISVAVLDWPAEKIKPPLPQKPWGWVLNARPPFRKYILCAESEGERDAWVAAVQRRVNPSDQQSQSQPASPPHSSPPTSPHVSPSSPSEERPVTTPDLPQAQPPKPQQLREEPETAQTPPRTVSEPAPQLPPSCVACKEAVPASEKEDVPGGVCHRRCLRCRVCNTDLSTGTFFVYQDAILCTEHRMSTRECCGHCKEPIEGRFMDLFGTKYHIEHIFCGVCGQPTPEPNAGDDKVFCDSCWAVENALICGGCNKEIDSEFFEQDNAKWHPECYQRTFCPRCTGCCQIITDTVVTAVGEKWHTKCFACAHCATPLVDQGTFYTHEGSVYCKEHFKELFASRCRACGFAIEGKTVIVTGNHYHVECFVCSDCGCALEASNLFFDNDGGLHCKLHRYGLPEDETASADDGVQADGAADPVAEEEEEPRPCTPAGKISDAALVEETQPSEPQEPVREPQPTQTEAVPEVPLVLGRPMGACIAMGIKESVIRTADSPPELDNCRFHQATASQPVFTAPNGTTEKFQFEDFAPHVFRAIRQMFGIADPEYLDSIAGRPLTGGAVGEGKSGMLFFFSADKRYIVKTVTRLELPFFVRILRNYYDHMQANHDTLLPRFYGLHKIKFNDMQPMRLIVMNNVFLTDLKPEEVYDLKGSTHKRLVTEEEIKRGVKVLKDLNLKSKLNVGNQLRERLVRQLNVDSGFLREYNIMDYSLLLGINRSGASSGSAPLVKPLSTSSWQLQRGGITAEGGSATYFLGIIDILQEFNLKKMLESAAKKNLMRVMRVKKADADPNAISAVESSQYQTRFVAFMESIIE